MSVNALIEYFTDAEEMKQREKERERQRAAPPVIVVPDETTPAINKRSMWSDFDQSAALLSGDNTNTSGCMVEKDRYLKEALLPRNRDPLLWWHERTIFYPKMAPVMRRRLCVMATSVPSERVFSKAGQLVTERRTRLAGWKINKIMFIHANMDKFEK